MPSSSDLSGPSGPREDGAGCSDPGTVTRTDGSGGPSGDGGPLLTRRRLLAALGAGGIGTAVYATEFYVPDEPVENPPDSLGTESATPDGVWNTTGGGYGNSRHVAVEPIEDPTVSYSFTVRARVGAVTDDTAYLARPGNGQDGDRIEARRLPDGSLRWEATVPGYARTPGLFGDRVFVTGDTTVHAYRRDGVAAWSTDLYATLSDAVHEAFLPDEPAQFSLSPPVVADGVVYVRSSFGLHGLDGRSGEALWRLWTDGGHYTGWRRPVLGSNGVYYVGQVAHDSHTASVQYATPDGSFSIVDGVDEFCPPPSLDESHLYVGPGRDRLGSLFSYPRVGTGGFDPGPWTFLGHHTSAPRGRETTGPAVGPDHAYVGDVVRRSDGLLASVYALDPANGTVAWEHRVDVETTRDFDPALEPLLSEPTVADGTLYVGLAPVVDSSPTSPEYVEEEAGVLALSTETGDRQWFQPLGFLPSSLGVADGVLVAGGRENVAVVVDESG